MNERIKQLLIQSEVFNKDDTVLKETEKFSMKEYLKALELTEVRVELQAKLETAMLMSKLNRMSNFDVWRSNRC